MSVAISNTNAVTTFISEAAPSLDVAPTITPSVAPSAKAGHATAGAKLKGRVTSAASARVHRLCLRGLAKVAYGAEKAALRPLYKSAAKFRKVKPGISTRGLFALTRAAVRAHSRLASDEEKLAFANGLKYPSAPDRASTSSYGNALNRRQVVPPPR